VSYRIELGRRGEALAAVHLEGLGHRILDRNWRCELGELDLVTAVGDQVVAVEVKTRSSLSAGHPFEAISAVKLQRLQRLGARWCADHGVRIGRLRVDIVGIVLSNPAAPMIEHLEGVR
jgi:putative endonuclease